MTGAGCSMIRSDIVRYYVPISFAEWRFLLMQCQPERRPRGNREPSPLGAWSLVAS